MSVFADRKIEGGIPPKPPEQSSPPVFDGGTIGSLDALALLRRYSRLIGATILGGTLAATIAAFTLPEEFTATSTLAFERRDAQFSEVEAALEGSDFNKAAIETEIAVITSRQFIDRLVDSFNLLADPFFNSHLSNGESNPDEMPALSTQRENAVTSFLANIAVLRGDDSLAVSIQATHADAKKAAALANAVADTYVEHSLERKRDAINAAVVSLESRIAQLATRIAETEQKIANHIRDNQLDISGDETRRDDLLRAEITQLKAQLQLSLEQQPANESSFAADPIDQLNTTLANLEEELQKVTMAEIRHRAFEQELVTDRNRYNQMVDQLLNLDSQAGLQRPSARVISRAVVPIELSFPRRKMIIAGGFLGSAMLSILLALVFDGLFTRIQSDQRITQISGLLNLAYIPEARSGAWRKAVQPFEYIREHPGSFYAEAMRSLFTACRRSDIEHPPKVVMMTSALPAEGKSTVSVGLAITAARLDFRTVVVDLDLHRCGVSKILDVSQREDRFSAYLSGKGDLSDIIQSDPEVPGLDIIAAVPGVVPPSTLLSSSRLSEMLAALRRDYDFVILDTPAALVVNDASLLAALVDAAVLVVRWSHTTEKAFRDAVRRLRINQIPLTGTVINRVEPRTHARYGYGGALAYYKQAKNYYTE